MEKAEACETVEIKQLTDHELHHKMVCTSEKEREITAQMIGTIAEAAKRRFYLDLGFGTLFDYLTLGLHYSAAAAQRRISAARVTEELPEVKAQILDGSLTLSALAQAEKFFRTEQKNDHVLNLDEKKMILKQLVNQSSREAEKMLLQMSSAPEQLQPEKVKPLSAEFTQITLNANSEFMALLEDARGLLGHQMPGASIAEVLAEMMKLGLSELKKKKFKIKTTGRRDQIPPFTNQISTFKDQAVAFTAQNAKPEKNESAEPASDIGSKTDPLGFPGSDFDSNFDLNSNSGSIPNAVKREVYLRDQGRCVVLNPKTGKPCWSRAFLEYDHFPIPKAKGGPSTTPNLRLACRFCNRLHAVQSYGRTHILKHMNQQSRF